MTRLQHCRDGGEDVAIGMGPTSGPVRAWRCLFALGSVAMAPFVGPRRYNRAKLDAYECGIEPTPQPVGGGRIPVKFFLVAMLFIVFDIETIFLYPWAVSFHKFARSLRLLRNSLVHRHRRRASTPTYGGAAGWIGTDNGYRRETARRAFCSPPSRSSSTGRASPASGRPRSAWPAARSR